MPLGDMLGSAGPRPPETDTTPVVQIVFVVMGLSLALVVLVAGLLAMAALRRQRRLGEPTRTPHVDAWAEAGRRARPEPSAGDLLGEETDAQDRPDDDGPLGSGRDG
ncbi:MAG: hypothetical protein KatS3mg103_0353 [Phycisphaerales bacterium]|nr:MAG: hypothetical protein KatS3mg103_0353 [Phycisphaerales bacterium]